MAEASLFWSNTPPIRVKMLFFYELLASLSHMPHGVLLVTKPYMERRALATFEAQWPDKLLDIRVCSQGGSLGQYCNDEQPLELVINIMAGDLQRIIEYPKRGLQSRQRVPVDVRNTYK